MSSPKPLCECGNGKPIYAKGLCSPCYRKALLAAQPPCDCGKPIEAKGMCRRCYKKARYQADREQVLADGKARYQANRGQVLADRKVWYLANRDQKRADSLAWHKNNPDKAQAKRQRYRARLLEADDGFTNEDWQEVLETYSYRCAYCGIDGPMTMDHVQPLSKGGRHHKSNIAPACKSCNSRKGDRTLLEFARLMVWPSPPNPWPAAVVNNR